MVKDKFPVITKKNYNDIFYLDKVMIKNISQPTHFFTWFLSWSSVFIKKSVDWLIKLSYDFYTLVSE